MKSHPHPDRNTLWLVAVGRASEQEIEFVGSHLEVCGVCAKVFDSMSLGKDPGVANLMGMARDDAMTAAPTHRFFLNGQNVPQEEDRYSTLSPNAQPLRESDPSEASTSVNDQSLSETPWDHTPDPSKKFVSEKANANSESDQRFEILRPHAKGGLGEVFVARDRELQREVALKEIQLEHSNDLECRSRFILEAQVTGGLEHPGIVPVYSMGQHSDGRLYYAMRFIQGESLKEAIDCSFQVDSNERGGMTAGRPTVAFRKLLNRFTHVCNAVGYAHSRGVLHRDIKPANIMLGKFDETLLVDWGLAKIKGRDESQRTDIDSDEQTLRLKPSGDSSGTQLGTLVGTPAFMSPEQASGNTDSIGLASDVYSLGATLYYLLTGVPPFGRDKVHAILEKVKHGDFEKPTLVLTSVPKSLEAICLKAMATRPSNRYQYASAIAEDIERWLADEPIDVHQDSTGDRIGRWMRRNRSLFASILIALMMLSTVSVTAFILVNAARRAAVSANNRSQLMAISERESREAETLAKDTATKLAVTAKENERIAIEAKKLAQGEADKANQLSSFLLGLFQASDPVGQGKGNFVGKPSAVNLTARDLLDRGALKLIADPEINAQPLAKAAISGTIGDVYRQLGFFSNAKPLLDEALALRLTNLDANHEDIATSYYDLGFWYHDFGDYEMGLSHYEKALAIRREIQGAEGQRLVANTLNNIAWLKGYQGDSEEARKLFLEAAKIREVVLGRDHRDCVFSYLGAAFCSIELGRWLEAIPKLIWARWQLQKVDDNRNITSALTTFAQARVLQNCLGATLAEASFRETLRLTELELGSANVHTALARFELGANQAMLGKDVEAMKHFDACLIVARNAVKMRHPRVRPLIVACTKLMNRQGRDSEAESLWQEFCNAQKERFGEHHRYAYEAMISQAAFFRTVEKTQDAINNYEIIEKGLKRLDFPTQPWLLALSYSEHCSILCEQNDDFQTAKSVALESIQIFDTHSDLKRDHPFEWAHLNCNLGKAQIYLDKSTASEQLEIALSLAKKLQPNKRAAASNQVMTLQTDLSLRQNDFRLAEELCLKRKVICRKLPGKLIEIAVDLMRCIAVAEANKELASEEKNRFCDACESEAVRILRAAISAGWKEKNSILENTQFERLRIRKDFIELSHLKN